MKFAAIIAAALATANAVKMTEDQVGGSASTADSTAPLVSVGSTTESDSYMGETKTDITYAAVDLDQIQLDIEAWYSDTASPFIADHKNMVYKAALAEMEAEHGALLETCDEGTACRERYIKELREKITEIWKRTLTNFKESIASAVLETRNVVETRWSDLQECQTTHPCCSISEIFWINNVKKIKTVRSQYSSLVTKWFEFDLRRIEIEHICPITINRECDVIGTCWDGSARDVLNDCDCPGHYPPACPTTECRNGIEVREINTCKCINEMPSTAFNVHTEYVDSNETIKITFEDLNGHQDNEGYFVYLNGHRVICQESPEMLRDGSEMVASGLLCTVGLGTIMDTPYNYNYGDLVQAQVADVMDGKVETELSALGGEAVLPLLADFVAIASVWEGDFHQTDFQSIRDGTPDNVEHQMKFDSLYIGENIVAGEGQDTVGHFVLAGTRVGFQLAFNKSYTDAVNQDAQDWMQYEGTIDAAETNIGGQWQAYRSGEPRTYSYDGVVYDQYRKNPYNDRFSLYRD